jgi:outer membrane protein TolC
MITLKAISVALSMISGNADVLSIDQAVAIALQNSYAVKNAQETVNSNEQRVREAGGGLGPKITTNYQYLRYGHASTGTIGSQTIVFTPLDTNTWSTQLTMPIDIVGVWKSNLKAAKAGVQASRDTKTATQNDLKQNVRKAYLNVLRAKGLVEISKQARVNILARVDQAKKQFDAGAIAKIDLKRLEAQKSSSDSDVINANNGYSVSKQILNLALNRPIETDFDVENLTGIPAIQSSLDKLIELGQDYRPEVISLKNTVIALDASKKFAGQSLAPSLNLSIQNSQTLDPVGLNPQRETNTTVLNLAVPLYDSGVARAKMQQSQATINQTKNNLDLLKLSISQEVRSALTNMSNAMARQRSAIEQDELAKEVVRIARIRRDAGEGTVLEIIDAETQWVSAQNNLINSMYDYLGAYADLQRAVGSDDIDHAIEQYELRMKGKK